MVIVHSKIKYIYTSSTRARLSSRSNSLSTPSFTPGWLLATSSLDSSMEFSLMCASPAPSLASTETVPALSTMAVMLAGAPSSFFGAPSLKVPVPLSASLSGVSVGADESPIPVCVARTKSCDNMSNSKKCILSKDTTSNSILLINFIQLILQTFLQILQIHLHLQQ
mmetsp:Transcript_20024/g.41986  ORF Transcript_20024/g.41986 Transcript_20024/m.41986 type:complete len:167 (+) Transcript_20024:89-589(+)